MFGSSVIVIPICLNKDVELDPITLPQADTCAVCGEFSAIKLTTECLHLLTMLGL